MASSATAVPSGLALNVECVEPGGKICGLISSSRAQMPASGLRPLVIALPNTRMSGLTPKCSIDHSLPVRIEAHLDFVDDEQDAVLVEHFLQLDEEVLRRDDVAAGALDRLDVEGGVFRLAGLGVPHAVVFALEQALELLARSERRTPPCSCPSGRGSDTGTARTARDRRNGRSGGGSGRRR